MSSYPIVLTDEFCIIFFMSTNLNHVRFGTSSWAYEGWKVLVYQRTYPKDRFSQNTLAEYAGYAVGERRYFPPSASTIHSTARPAPSNWHTTQSKCPSTVYASRRRGEIEQSVPSPLFPSSASKRQVKQRPRGYVRSASGMAYRGWQTEKTTSFFLQPVHSPLTSSPSEFMMWSHLKLHKRNP